MIGSHSPPAPAPEPADVGIVAALGIEVGFLTDRLNRVRQYATSRHTVIEGEHGSKLVALIVGGTGRTQAARATRILLDGHRPRWVLSAGFAGALDPALRRNDVVLPSEIVDPDGRLVTLDVAVPNDTTERGPKLRTGRLVTVDAIVRTAQEKAALRATTGADLVDMESSAIASICGERLVRFLSVRVISDEANIDLPVEVLRVLSGSRSYQVGAALRAIWNRPASLKDFWTLHEHAQNAADRLADVALGVVAQLPG